MIKYKIIENRPNLLISEVMLNDYTKEGWKVHTFGQFQILLEREEDYEKQVVNKNQLNEEVK